MSNANLLDHIKTKHNLSSDYQLAKEVGTSAPQISKVRRDKQKIGDTLLLQLHEYSGIPFAEMRRMIAE